MKSVFSSRRNKIPHNNEGKERKETPFFTKESKKPFFNMASGGAIQTKLSIGQPGDKYEKEADTVADAVVNKTAKPDVQKKKISSIQRESLATPQEDEKLGTAEQRMEEDKLVQEKPEIQKMDAPEEEIINKMDASEEKEESIQKMEDQDEEVINKMEEGGEKEDEELVQTKKNSGNQKASSGLSNKIKNKAGKGKKMSKGTKTEMEASFGKDFGEVNIHTDQDAITMNKELGAQAFTYGKDIYFNSGKFDPKSTQGKHLLAHELTHVLQQKHNIQRKEAQTTSQNGVMNSPNPLTGLKKGDGLVWGTFGLRPRVRLLQQKLNEKTLSGLVIDGMFGSKTLAALRYFRALYYITPIKKDKGGHSFFQEMNTTDEEGVNEQTLAITDEIVDPITANALNTPMKDESCNEVWKAPQPFQLGKVKNSAPMNLMVCTETGILRLSGNFNWIIDYDKVPDTPPPLDFRMRIAVYETGENAKKKPLDTKIARVEEESTHVERIFKVPKNKNYQFEFIVHKPRKGQKLTGSGKVHQTEK